MSRPGYAALGVYGAGEDKPQLLSVGGKVIVFDTPEMAKQVVPILGQERQCMFSADGESAYFLPLQAEGINRVVVLTDYDVYNLPPGLPIQSETRLMDWRHHIHFAQVFCDVGQFVELPDGTYRNAAIEQAA